MRRVLLAVAIVLAWSAGALAAQATLTWTDNAGDPCPVQPSPAPTPPVSCQERGYYVERKSEACASTGGAWTRIGETGADITTYVDATVVVGATYCYRVQAWNTQCAPGSCLKSNPDGTSACEVGCVGGSGLVQTSTFSNLAGITVAAAPVPGMVWNAVVVAGSEACDAVGCTWQVTWMEPTVDATGAALTTLTKTTLYTMLRGTTTPATVEVPASANPGAAPVVATSAKMPIALGQAGVVELWITASNPAGEGEAQGIAPLTKDRTTEQLAPSIPSGLTVR